MLKRLTSIIVLLVLSLLTTSQAAAQAFREAPQPMTTDQLLESVVTPLSLSDAQIASLRPLHEAYVREARAMRETLAPKLEENREAFLEIPFGRDVDASAALTYLDTYRRLIEDLSARDDALFEQIAETLSEEQQQQLPEVKLQRRINLLQQTGIADAWDFTFVDVASSLRSADLPTDAVEKLTPSPLEARQQTALLLHQLTRKTIDAYQRWARELEGEDISFDRKAVVWGEHIRTAAPTAKSLRNLQRQTIDQWGEQLSFEQRNRLTRAFRERAYRICGFPDLWRLHERFPALDENVADESLINVVDEFQQRYLQRYEEIVNALMDAADASAAADMPHYYDQQAVREANERLMEYHSKRQQYNKQAEKELLAGLPEKLHKHIESRIVRYDQLAEKPIDDLTSDESIAKLSRGIFPSPVLHRDIALMIEVLQLEQPAAGALRTAHHDYLQQYAMLYQEQVAPLRTPSYRPVEEGSTDYGPPPLEEVEAYYGMLGPALDQVQKLDHSLYTTVQVPEDSPAAASALAYFKALRSSECAVRGTYAIPAHGYGAFTTSPMQAAAATLQPGELSNVAIAWMDDFDRLAELATESREHGLVYSQGHWMTLAAHNAARDEPDEEKSQQLTMIGVDWRERQNQAVESIRKSRRSYGELSLAMVNEAEELLDPSTAREFRDRYLKAAYPGIYSEGEEMLPYINAALQLDSLTGSQQDELIDTKADLLESVTTVEQQLVEHLLSSPWQGRFGASIDKETEARWKEKLSTLQFQYNEIQSSARLELIRILNDEQRRAIDLSRGDQPAG